MGGGFIEGKNKNTYVSCWRSKQMCSQAEYAKHIHSSKNILAWFCRFVNWRSLNSTQKNVGLSMMCYKIR